MFISSNLHLLSLLSSLKVAVKVRGEKGYF